MRDININCERGLYLHQCHDALVSDYFCMRWRKSFLWEWFINVRTSIAWRRFIRHVKKCDHCTIGEECQLEEVNQE